MSSGKNNALQRAYLAGLQSQTSVYGSTIPVIYGTTRTNPLIIWFGGFRKGQGLSSSKKSASGPPNYVACADFLLGHNPITAMLQLWYNNEQLPYSLNFRKYTAPVTYPFLDANGHVTIPDANFYAVLAVTADMTYDITFADYGGIGTTEYSGTFEAPLWNVNYAGPDPTNQNGYRQFPAVCQWIGGPLLENNPTVHFPPGSLPTVAGFTGTVHIYYAQLASTNRGGGGIPADAARLHWEPVLGNGNEYDIAGASSQQIIYPEYAGFGTNNIDCGVSGVPPALGIETCGSFPVIPPNGDADFPDMIEDIFKSGPAQAGTGAALAYGDIHHGLGCLDFPGTVQKKVLYGGVENALSTFAFDLANTAGNFLFVYAQCDSFGGGSTLGISDSAGNTWTPIFPVAATSYQLWYCVAKASSPGTTVTLTNTDRYMDIIALEIAGVDTIDGSPVVNTGTGGTYSASITTTNKPGEDSLILSFTNLEASTGGLQPPPYRWTTIAAGAGTTVQTDQYSTKYPKTYTVSYPTFGVSAQWGAVLIALKNSQPNTFTSPLGNILDDATMQNTRAQCRAYGLYGSLAMDSQKKAADWLEELYRVANAAPVWSGFTLKSIPYAEQSAVGNGSIYNSPTAPGPVANLSEYDFVTTGNDPPVTVVRQAQVDVPNLQQIQSPNRASYYAQIITSQPDNGSMSLYGTRKDTPKNFMSIQTTDVAVKILGIMIREANIVRNTYKFTLQTKWPLLEAMDLVTIPIQATMPAVNPAAPIAGTIAVRLTSVSITDDFQVQCEAEPFIYGMRSPGLTAVPLAAPQITPPAPYVPNLSADPGDVNVPIFIEPPSSLYQSKNASELLIAISGGSSIVTANIGSAAGSGFAVGDTLAVAGGGGSGSVLTVSQIDTATGAITEFAITSGGHNYANTTDAQLTVLTGAGTGSPTATIVIGTAYGGCIVYMSTDGGNSYNPVGPNSGVVQGSATTGFTVGAWPAAADPDTTNDLNVNLTESLGTLDSFQLDDEDAFIYPCWVAGGGSNPIPYELMTYAVANLTGTYKYQLSATGGNHLRRAVYGMPDVGQGVDHPSGSRFAFLNPTNPIAAGIINIPMLPQWIGTTLYFKFLAFNTSSGMTQTLPEVTAYSYTPTGLPSGVNPIGVPSQLFLINGAGAPGTGGPITPIAEIPLTPSGPGNFTVAHGLSAAPKIVLVQMTSGGAIWLQSPSFDSTNIYLTASAAGVTGVALCLAVAADATVPLNPTGPGNFSFGHGLSSTPALALVQMSSGGAIWFQNPTGWDSSAIYLTAASAGIMGTAYVWLAVPTSTNFASVSLAPSAPGNFSVPHGLGKVPFAAIVRMKSGGAIWLQSPTNYDATNVYLTASAAGILGEVEVWC